MKVKTVYLGLMCGLSALLSSCTNPKGGLSQQSQIQMVMPDHPDVSAKSTNSLLSLKTPKICYYVNITGTGIAKTDKSCYPSQGLHSNFLNPGQSYSAQVPKGDGRIFEIYAFLTQNDQACEALTDLNSLPINRLYLMGASAPKDLVNDDETIEITVNFPGINQHFGKTSGQPESCYIGLTNLIGRDASDTNGAISAGNYYRFTGGIANGSNSSIQKGSQFQFIGGLNVHAR